VRATDGDESLFPPPGTDLSALWPRVLRATVFYEEKDAKMSKGFGFVEFEQHMHALACLRLVNNNEEYAWAAAGGRAAMRVKSQDRPRLMVSFTVENAAKVKLQEQRRQNRKEELARKMGGAVMVKRRREELPPRKREEGGASSKKPRVDKVVEPIAPSSSSSKRKKPPPSSKPPTTIKQKRARKEGADDEVEALIRARNKRQALFETPAAGTSDAAKGRGSWYGE
jgi:nucleolar protein 4